MGRPRQITDERILVVARECFLELGPSAPTAVIAERLGISQAVLFQRFATKEELLRAALTPPDEAPWHALADQGPDGRPLAEQLTELANAIDSFFREIFPATSAPC